ncbi:MAG: hypothetical protein ACQETH_05970 [Candidatus Rifleibacteriota bacterium]
MDTQAEKYYNIIKERADGVLVVAHTSLEGRDTTTPVRSLKILLTNYPKLQPFCRAREEAIELIHLKIIEIPDVKGSWNGKSINLETKTNLIQMAEVLFNIFK